MRLRPDANIFWQFGFVVDTRCIHASRPRLARNLRFLELFDSCPADETQRVIRWSAFCLKSRLSRSTSCKT